MRKYAIKLIPVKSYEKATVCDFSEFAAPSCKWDILVRLQCKSYKFGQGTTCNLISHVYVFVITRPVVHRKNRSNSLETRSWKDISYQTLWLNSHGNIHIRVWPWRLKQNISWHNGFQTPIFVFINQPEAWWWE